MSYGEMECARSMEELEEIERQRLEQASEDNKSLAEVTADKLCKNFLAFMFADMPDEGVFKIYEAVKIFVKDRDGTEGLDLCRGATLIAIEVLDYVKTSIAMKEEEI